MQELIDEGKTGLLFAPNNVNDMAEKIDLLSENDFIKMRRYVQTKAKSLLWTERAKTLIQNFREMTNAA